MADVVVSVLVSTIMDNLKASVSLEGLGLAGSLKTEVESLESTLTTIQAVLHDAEEKQSKSEAIKNWLRKLKQAAYDLQDVLDDFNYEALRHRSKVSTFFSLQNPLLFRLNMARRFKNVRNKLVMVAGERSMFHLREGVVEAEIKLNSDRQTSSLVNESEVFGRESEKEKIVSMLLSNASHHDDLSVYAICGMGGLGKTTIAQLVYNDKNVAKAFDLRVWVCVSDDFDIKRLTKAILESIEGSSCDVQELDPLQRRLVEMLSGKRLLLVLDDVWNEYHDKWDVLKQALRYGVKGSTVIVTTRLEKVALMMATAPFHRLGYLSDDDSRSLFKQKAFKMGMTEGNVNLETIGRQIVRRCGGVPLAIKAIGSILRFKSRESDWLRVKESKIWDLEDEGSRILAVLRLSYEHLPPYVRQCFSFCSLIPKDSIMEKDMLIGLWMANGFIPSRVPSDLHDTGCEIFSELTWRSFFQEIKEDADGTITCKMHDLIHDVATSIMRDECCVIDPDETLKIQKTTRHLFVRNSFSLENIGDIPKLQSLQSLILSNAFRNRINTFIRKQKYLKVLDFKGRCRIIAFESLKYLRYLRLDYGHMRTLPESTSSLYNLQTLKLRHCYNLERLPKGMKHLKNLTYLDIKGCSALTSMPADLGQLSRLRKLSKFIVGKNKGCGIDELKDLALEGELSITGLCKVKSSTEAKNANLIRKHNLRSLSLSWRRKSGENSSHGNDEEILTALHPHSSLKKLHIIDYQGVSFPYWMMDLLLPNLVEISLDNCQRCHQLPPLGKLRFLKVLSIACMGALKYLDNNFYGDGEISFPSLEVLEICLALCLEELTIVNGRENFPLLTSLSMEYCPKLVKLPVLQNKEHLETLTIDSSRLKSSSDLLDNLSNLKHLHLRRCLQLESLPAGLQNLSSLETLNLSDCDNLVSLPVNGLQGLSCLSSLGIENCKKFASLSEGVRYLTSLQELLINGCPELTSLPQSIQHLSSLRSLRIWICEKLICLPDDLQGLPLLSRLELRYCSNLMSLPRGIAALQTLIIIRCPHLERRCEKDIGEDWPKIAHIPSIEIRKY